MRSKCASDQTPAGYNIGVAKAGVIGTLYNIGKGGDKRRTTLRYRGRGGAIRVYGVQARCTPNGCIWRVASTKYLLGLELDLLPLGLALVISSAWRVRSPPEGPLDFFCNPNVAC